MSTATAGTITPRGNITVTPRNIRFAHDLPKAATWAGGDVVATAVFNALSLTFPDGERMFMDAVRHYKHLCTGKLLEDANAFIIQEAIHTREHVMLNKVMDGQNYPLDAIRANIKYRTQMAEKMGPMTMLAATIALEHFTALLGNAMLEDGSLLEGAPDDVRRMWQWHALEETEHKAVAYDVFNVATAGMGKWHRFSIRARAMFFITIQFSLNITQYSSMLLAADGMNRTKATFKVLWFLFGKPGFFRTGWKGYWDWYKPSFHPWDHDNSAMLDKWRLVFANG